MTTGSTRLFVVIGDPVAQVQAPMLVNPLFAELGLDATLVPVHARPADFPAVVRGLQRIVNLDGMLVTIPHKVAACELADLRGPAAAVIGTANALRREPDGRWLADNFDGAGFVRGLTGAGHPPGGRRVLLVGAGGAGSAIAVSLLAAGTEHLVIHDQDPGRLAALLDRLEARWPGRASGPAGPVTDGVDIAVNATALGLRPDDPLPFAPAALPPGAVVADIVMKPAETPLLRAAAALGLPTHPGIHMLTHQLDLYRDFFRLDPAGVGPGDDAPSSDARADDAPSGAAGSGAAHPERTVR
jgi:shikimate dehydrogenase